nr:hypothetical protein [Kofleriaceae bacterium]
MRGAFVAVLVVGACAAATQLACGSDPSLTVDVQNPSGLGIASTQVSVYQSAELACDGVEFGDLDDEQLQALLVTEETIGSDGQHTGELTGMSRTDTKVIAARAFASDGTFVAAGCVEKGVIGDDDSVVITTEPTVDVSLGVTVGSGSDPASVSVAVTDPTGATVDDRRVSWTVYGPAGTVPYEDASSFQMLDDGEWRPQQASCTASGAVKMHPMPPNLISGYAVQMRVEWAREVPPEFTSLTALPFGAASKLSPTGFGAHYCAVHVSATAPTHRLACADSNGGGGKIVHDFSVTVANGSTTLTSQADENLPADAVALITHPNADGTADVYAVGQTGTVTALFGAPAGVPAIVASVDDAIFVPGCGSSAPHVLVHESAATDVVAELDERGGNAQVIAVPQGTGDGKKSELVSAGCVAALNPGAAAVSTQVFVIDNGTISTGLGSDAIGEFTPTSTHMLYACSAGACSDITLFTGAGVGFTAGAEPHMITTTVDATGVELAQVVMAPGKGGNGTGANPTSGEAHLVERSAVAAASVPDRLVTGNFDADSDVDQIWDIASGKRGNTTTFEIAYGRLANGAPLEALSSPQAASLDDLLVEDVNGDGIDDVIATGAILGVTAFTGVLVVPMGVAPASLDVAGDAPCGTGSD